MMNVALHRAFLTRLLVMTGGESPRVEALRKSLRITSEAFDSLLDAYCDEGLLTIEEGEIVVTLEQRLSLSVKAVELGTDFEAVSRGLGWLEFEEMSAKVFEANGFRVERRFRFSAEGRRWEIDLLAARAPYLVCAECKRWERGIGNSTARGIIETHLEKVEMFSKHLEWLRGRAGLDTWTKAIVVPMAVTLSSTPLYIYRRVSSVSVLTLPRFLNEFDGQLECLAHFRIDLPEIGSKKVELTWKVSGSRRPRRRL